MKKRELRDYLNDLIDSCNDILEFTKGFSFADFSKDKKTINAVIRSLEIIGEATKKLPAKLKSDYSDIPWKQMAGMRDKLIHEYFGIDKQMVWQVVKKEIPKLLPLIKNIKPN